MKDLIENETCGFSFRPDKPEEFFEKLEPFLIDNSQLSQTQQNARRVAAEQFDKKTQIEATIQFIQNLPGL